MLEPELLWAVVWALVHLVGLAAMLLLRGRSARQLHVAERWRAAAAPADRAEAADLVVLTRDRHRRNGALLLVVASYLLLGLLVLSYTVSPWLDDLWYRVASRLILVSGEVVLIGSAWASVVVGDRIAEQPPRRTPV